MAIKIVIEGELGTAHGPFPFAFTGTLATLSGRKKWASSKAVQFDASAINLRKLRECGQDIEFEDRTGAMAELQALEAMATQHAPQVELPANYTPRYPPRGDFQRQAIGISWEREAYALLLEMGLGKTYILIANIGMLHVRHKLTGVLVVTKKGIDGQWLDEQMPEHLDPAIKWRGISWKQKEIEPSVFRPDTRAPLVMFAINIDALRTPKGFAACEDFLLAHKGKSMMIIDESQDIKNFTAARTKAALKLGKLATFRRIATGSPIGKNVVDAFAQFYFLDRRILGHNYLTSFRARYCIMGGWEGKQIVGQKNTEEFYRLIAPHAFRGTKAEFLDLPPKIYVQRTYEMGAETAKHYKSLKNTYLTEIVDGELYDAQHAAVCMLRLQQLLCGYLPLEDGTIKQVSDERIEVMMDIVEQVEGPVVIWARFTQDIEKIQAALEKEYGAGCVVTYYGETKKADREEAKRKFLTGEARFFVSNPQAGGTGLNLQGKCQTVIYYSNNFNAIDRWQSEDRTHRIGMSGAVTYFDIVARGSVDRGVLANLRAKKSISDLTFDQIRMAIAA